MQLFPPYCSIPMEGPHKVRKVRGVPTPLIQIIKARKVAVVRRDREHTTKVFRFFQACSHLSGLDRLGQHFLVMSTKLI